MGLLQKAVETYDCHAQYAGLYREGHAVLAPVAHVVTKAALEITLNADGELCAAATVDAAEPKILIPATESSAGRSGTTICAHPLCDQLGYISPCVPKKYENYLENLTKWTQSAYTHPMLLPILTYVRKGTILRDLQGLGLIRLKEDGSPENEKLLVRWRVLDVGQESACWKDQSLFQAFEAYYHSISQDSRQDVCMVSGEKTRSAKQHPKGIIALNGNAKLISANDTSGFTYRGRFQFDWQAATVGYEASQKAHNALRWLASEQAVQEVYGGRTFLCWNPQGKKTCKAAGPFMRTKAAMIQTSDYKKELKRTLDGYQTELKSREGVVIAAFDAATSGRLSLTYYNELLGSDFLQRLYDWDLHCCWPSYQYGIQSPSLYQIVSCAFGTEQTEKNVTRMVADDRVVRQQIQRLVSCRIDCGVFPTDLMMALVHHASAPLAHEKKVRESILTTACAVIRKYRYDRFREEWNMTLEPEKKDISYQYGRLLAVLEKVERDAYDRDTDREPNAIRQQSVFCQRPMYAASNIEKQLERAYFPKLKAGSRVFYKKLIGEIMEMIAQFPETMWNKPLKETYLMGYYLQRNALYPHNNENQDAEDENNDEV